jgi:hypothetical protein
MSNICSVSVFRETCCEPCKPKPVGRYQIQIIFLYSFEVHRSYNTLSDSRDFQNIATVNTFYHHFPLMFSWKVHEHPLTSMTMKNRILIYTKIISKLPYIYVVWQGLFSVSLYIVIIVLSNALYIKKSVLLNSRLWTVSPSLGYEFHSLVKTLTWLSNV